VMLKLRADAAMLPDELRKGVRCFESRWSFNYRFSIVCSGRNGERAAIYMIFEKEMLFWILHLKSRGSDGALWRDATQ